MRRQWDQAVIARDNEKEQRLRAEAAEAIAIEKERHTSELVKSERQANDQAQQRLAQLGHANHILQSIFRDLNPLGADEEGPPLEERLALRLDDAADALDAEAIGDVLTLARLQTTLGISYQGLGLPLKAISLLNKARDALTALLGADDPQTLSCQYSLAECHVAAGQRDTALEIHLESLRIRKETLGVRHRDSLKSLGGLAECYRVMGQLDLALPLLAESLELRKEVLGPEHLDTINSMNNLALGYRDDGQFARALELFTETWHLQEKVRGEEHPETLTAMNNIAVCHRDLGNINEALPLFEKTLEMRNQRLGFRHPATLISINNLAGAYRTGGQLDKSIPLFEELLQRKTDILGADHPSTLLTVANLAVNYKEAKRLADAVRLFQRAVDASKKFPELQWVEPHLAECLRDLGRQDEAIDLLTSLVAEARQSLPADSPGLAARLARLGWFFIELDLDALDEAESAIRDGLKIREQVEPDAWTTFSSRAVLGALLLKREQYADAEPLLVSGYKGMEKRSSNIPANARAGRLRDALENLIELYQRWNQPDQASPWQKKLDSLNREDY